MKIVKPYVNKTPIDALIEKCFNDNVKFTVLANEKLAIKPKTSAKKSIAKPKRLKRAKKWKKLTIYIVKVKKNGEKTIKPKIAKIPVELKTPTFKPKIHKIWIPKTNQKMFKAYFS
jgi:hypothetical protein